MPKEARLMQKVQLALEDIVYDFYKKIGEVAAGRCPEQVARFTARCRALCGDGAEAEELVV